MKKVSENTEKRSVSQILEQRIVDLIDKRQIKGDTDNQILSLLEESYPEFSQSDLKNIMKHVASGDLKPSNFKRVESQFLRREAEKLAKGGRDRNLIVMKKKPAIPRVEKKKKS